MKKLMLKVSQFLLRYHMHRAHLFLGWTIRLTQEVSDEKKRNSGSSVSILRKHSRTKSQSGPTD